MAEIVRSPRLAPARGYNHGLVYPAGRLLFVAGQVAWDLECRIVSDDLVEQWAQALDNVLEVVRSAGGLPEHVARMTVFVADAEAYARRTRELGKVWRARMGKHYPAMSLVQVARLLEPGAQVEIEATAVLP